MPLILAFVVVYPYVFDKKLDVNGDNFNYYLLGQALASGKGYVKINLPDEPAYNGFPPGYPAIIAAAMKVVSRDINAIKTVNGVFFLISVVLLFLLLDHLTQNRPLAFVTAALILFNSHYLRYATIIMSEVPFFLVSILALYVFTRLDLSKPPWKSPLLVALLLVLISSTYYIRTVGLALFGGILLYLLLRKHWIHATSMFSGFVLLTLPWYLRGQTLGGNRYISQLMQVNPYRPELGMAGLGDLAGRVGHNLVRYVTKEIPNGTLPFISADYQSTSAGNWIIGLMLLTLIAYGLYCLNARLRLLIGGYLLGIFGILLLWPDVWFGVRFILPVLPFLVLCLLNGAYHLLKMAISRANWSWQVSPLMFLVILLGFYPSIQQLHKNAQANYPPNFVNYFSTAVWARENTPPDAVISCRKPGMLYLFAGRHTIYYRNTLDDRELLDDLRQKQVNYVVLDQLGYSSTYRYLLPAIQKNAGQFQVVYRTPSPETFLLAFQP